MAPTRSLNVRITGDSRDFGRMVANVDRDSDRLQKRFSATADSASGLSLRVGAVSGSIGQLAPVIATAVPAIAGIGGAVAALGASLTAAAGGAGALGAGFGASMLPILAVGKQVTSRFEEIKKAYEAVQTAQREGTKEAKKNADQAMKGLSESERAMVGTLGRISGLQDKVLGGASDRIIGSLSRAIDKLAPSLEKLSKPFDRLGGALGGSIERIANALSGPTWTSALKSFVDSARKLVSPITTIFISIGNVMRDIATAALPMVQDAVKGVADKFRDIDRAATTGKIRQVVGDLVEQTKSWFNLFKAIGGLIVHVFSGSQNQGKSLVDTLTNIVKAVDGFVRGMREGSGSGGKFAAGVVSAFNTAKSAVRTAVAAIKGWLADHRDDINSVIRAFKNVAKFAVDTWQETLLPVVRRTVKAMKPIIEGIASVIRGVVRAVSGLLSGDWQKAWSGAGETVRGSWKIIKAAIVTMGGNALEYLRDLGPKLVKALAGAIFNSNKAIATGIGNAIVAAVKAVPGLIGGALKGLGGAITKGISSGFGKLNPFSGDGLGMGSLAGFAGGGSLMGAKSIMAPFASIAGRFGLHTSSGLRPGAITSSGNASWHGTGNAIDESGTPAGMMGYFRFLKANFGGRLRELIYTPGGVGIKDGRPFQYTGQVAADHYDHVHVAFTGDGHGRKPGTGDGIGDIRSLWTRAGGRASAANMAAAIAMAESGGNPGITHRNSDGSIDRGLWQINSIHGALSTLDRLGNARAAISISGNGANWNPWTVFRTGAYRRFLTASGGSGGSAAPSKGSSGAADPNRVIGHGYASGGPVIYDPKAVYDAAHQNTVSEERQRALDFLNQRGAFAPSRPAKGGGPTKGFTAAEAELRANMPAPPAFSLGTEFSDTIRLQQAQAALTPGTDDDVAAARARLWEAQILVDRSQPFGAGAQAEALENYKSVTDALQSLEDTIRQAQEAADANAKAAAEQAEAETKAREDQLRAYKTLIEQDYQRQFNVSQSQYATLAQALTDVVMQGAGQRVGLSLAGMSAPAGSVSRL